MSDLVIISILSYDISLDFLKSIRVGSLKYLIYFLAGINTRKFWNIPKENYFAPLRILNYLSNLFLIVFLILL